MVVSLYVALEAASIVLCLHYLYGRKFKFDTLTIGVIGLEVLWMNLIYYYHLDNNWTMMIYAIYFVYSGLKFGFDYKSIFINNILYIIILCIIQSTAIVLVRVLLGIYSDEVWMMLLINTLVFCITVFGLRKCNLFHLSRILQSREKIVLISLAVVIISLFIFLITYKNAIGFETLYYIIFFVSIILIILAAVDIGKHKVKMHEAEAELRLHKLYETSFKNLIDDICAKQHEFDNHINAIYSQHFLYETYDELVAAQKEYCKDIINENHYNKLLSKGNPIILGFLYGKFSEAEKRGIDISYKINIDDLECSVPIYKIVELLGNLIKNAVEALENEPDINRLQLVMREENSVILIKVANESKTVNYGEIQQFFKKGYSKKGKGRGYGLYNVKRICDEYGAQIKCDVKNDAVLNWLIFTVTIYKSL